MAYSFTAASSQYLSASSLVAGVPMTIAFHSVTPTTAVADQAIVSVGASNGNRNQISRSGTNIAANSIGTNSVSALASGQITASTPFHAAGVFASATSRTFFFNGTQVATNTNDVGTQSAFTETLIGTRRAASIGLYYTGNISEVGIWNAALTAAEIASLAKGMTCDKVRPQSLVYYAPLVRDLIDQKGGLTITNNNGATVANHPRVYA